MKKKRYSRQLIAKLTTKEVRSCEFYAKTGRRINAAKVQIDFYRKYNVVAKVIFCDDPAHKQTVIRWYTKQILCASIWCQRGEAYQHDSGNVENFQQ